VTTCLSWAARLQYAYECARVIPVSRETRCPRNRCLGRHIAFLPISCPMLWFFSSNLGFALSPGRRLLLHFLVRLNDRFGYLGVHHALARHPPAVNVDITPIRRRLFVSRSQHIALLRRYFLNFSLRHGFPHVQLSRSLLGLFCGRPIPGCSYPFRFSPHGFHGTNWRHVYFLFRVSRGFMNSAYSRFNFTNIWGASFPTVFYIPWLVAMPDGMLLPTVFLVLSDPTCYSSLVAGFATRIGRNFGNLQWRQAEHPRCCHVSPGVCALYIDSICGFRCRPFLRRNCIISFAMFYGTRGIRLATFFPYSPGL